MIDTRVFVAATRFGMGLGPGEAQRIGGDPRGWLISQLAPQPSPALFAQLLGTADAYEKFREVKAERKEVKQEKQAAAALPPSAPRPAPGPPIPGRAPRPMSATPALMPPPAPLPPPGTPLRDIYLSEVAARTNWAAQTPAPFNERLVQFWSNHFTVSIQRPVVLPIAGSFEREAIRPHVAGRFRDMLGAVAHHPAMLLYLDNAQSIEPNSIAGQRQRKGLNENLAREMMELHTLGVDGGYTQADVTEFARILTGWTLEHGRGEVDGRFQFEPRMHEPGIKTLLGAAYQEDGEAEGERVLDMLARHPATAHFIATKLVRHFIADDPPRAAVDAVAATFRQTDGDLAATMRAVIARPEAWSPTLTKLRTPNDLIIATLRALGDPQVEDKAILGSLNLLGQPPFAAPSPAGWPDRADAWLGPEAMMRRLQWAEAAAKRIKQADAVLLADLTIGPVMGPVTRQTIATDAREGTMLWLASREFQRR